MSLDAFMARREKTYSSPLQEYRENWAADLLRPREEQFAVGENLETKAEIDAGRTTAAKFHQSLVHRKKHDEMGRVLSLPVADYSNPPDLTDSLLRDPTKRLWADGREARLRPVQNAMLAAAVHAGGGYFMASTGSGKTFAAILAGAVMPNVRRVFIFTPASTVSNMLAEYFRLRNLFKVPTIHSVLQIRSVEELSKAREEAQGDLLDELILQDGGTAATTLLVFDEAHRLKNLSSARGGRVMRSMLRFPETRVIVMSGTMTSKSVSDAAHLAWYALRAGSPYPVQWGGEYGAREGHRMFQLEALAACTDVDGQPTHHDWAEVLPLIAKYYPELGESLLQIPGPKRTSLARLAFQQRLLTTPGVVLTTESEIAGLTLQMEGITLDVPDVVREAIQQLESGTDFNDMPIPDAPTAARMRKQVAQGFYYMWDWPKDSHGIPVVDMKWKAARSQWNKMVRTQIQDNARTGYDSEFLVYNNVKRQVLAHCTTDLERDWVHHIARTAKDSRTWEGFEAPDQALDIWRRLRTRAASSVLCVAWLDWSAIEKHKLEPPVKGVWLSTFLMEHVIAWAKLQPTPPIIWYEHKEVGAKLMQMGVPAYGAGTDPPKSGGLCALSVGVHSEGKNLQDRWSRQVMLCPMSSGSRWEQNLGRTYREGQTADTVYCFVYQHDESFISAINSARGGAAYAEDQGNKQKLLFAKYKNMKLFKITYAADFAELVDNNPDAA